MIDPVLVAEGCLWTIELLARPEPTVEPRVLCLGTTVEQAALHTLDPEPAVELGVRPTTDQGPTAELPALHSAGIAIKPAAAEPAAEPTAQLAHQHRIIASVWPSSKQSSWIESRRCAMPERRSLLVERRPWDRSNNKRNKKNALQGIDWRCNGRKLS